MITGNVGLYAPDNVDILDLEIMRHITTECGKVAVDGLCDMGEYGTGDDYEVEIAVMFKRKAGK